MSNNIEEDIKIVEEIRKNLGLYADGIKVRQGIAIENLLKEYKKNKKIVDKIEVKLNKLRENLSHYGDYKNLNILEKMNVERTDAKIEILQEILEEE